MRFLKKLLLVLVVVVGALALAASHILGWPDFGGDPMERLQVLERSKHFNGKSFENRPPNLPFDLMANLKDMMGGQVRKPPGAFPQVNPQFQSPPRPGLRAWWVGHAAVLVEVDGVRGITDPMLSDYAFPLRALAPKRYNPTPLKLNNLPPIDFVTISHDHYDHLDMASIQILAKQGAHFFVGLGIGAHLERWKVPENQIHEMDWWEVQEFKGLKIHCTPARHYSGRKAMDDSTLWTSWTIKGPKHGFFHSGDTGYGEHFKRIRDRLGAVDLALIKVGDYGGGQGWKDIHMETEKSIQAHVDLGAKTLLPIHWGTFELSNHAWDEPIRRAVKAAKAAGVQIVTPKLGEVFDSGKPFSNENWWERLSD